MEPTRVTRLLPWKSPDGKPCYLDTDGESAGYVSRLADEMEAVQLGMATELIGHAEALLSDTKAGTRELRYLSARLSEALRDTTRIAESRGDRLADHCPPATGGEPQPY
ncbi:hypothetical protein ACZ90_49080 [Streptomyces albus subsp. albus]|nr:hypothetical protein ACZ90_49080 [Streptomyces albus subsp. albus]